MDLIFTHIYEAARRKMRLSRDEYALCNYVATWSQYPGSARSGWCNRTLQQKADFIDVTPRGLTKMQNRLIELDLIEKDPLTSHVRTTLAWWETVNEARDREQSSQRNGEQSSFDEGTKFPKNGEQSSRKRGNKVPTHSNTHLFNEKGIEEIVIDAVEETPVQTVVSFLNFTLQPARPFSPDTKKTVEAVNARLRDKYTVDDICLVIEHKVTQWKGDAKMEQYLRPETLFGTGKFEGYLVAATSWEKQGKPQLKNGQHGNSQNGPVITGQSVAGAFSDY